MYTSLDYWAMVTAVFIYLFIFYEDYLSFRLPFAPSHFVNRIAYKLVPWGCVRKD